MLLNYEFQSMRSRPWFAETLQGPCRLYLQLSIHGLTNDAQEIVHTHTAGKVFHGHGPFLVLEYNGVHVQSAGRFIMIPRNAFHQQQHEQKEIPSVLGMPPSRV